uniref:Allograft inflammatory factor 1-like n=1 Tax=Nothobranchius furzeri TaxID=105023 RepID=A0A8C6NUF0_NOTFU
MPASKNVQGGKAFGLLKEQQKQKLDEINKEYLEDQKYRDEEGLLDCIIIHPSDMMGLKRMMEKLGVPKTHLELKKMIVEASGGSSNTINYRDFVKMMLGKRSAVLKILVFEDKANSTPFKPDGPPPKRDITSLP